MSVLHYLAVFALQTSLFSDVWHRWIHKAKVSSGVSSPAARTRLRGSHSIDVASSTSSRVNSTIHLIQPTVSTVSVAFDSMEDFAGEAHGMVKEQLPSDMAWHKLQP